MTTSIAELDNMTDMERTYRVNERLEEMYLTTTLEFQGYTMTQDMQLDKAMECKWRMLVFQGGN